MPGAICGDRTMVAISARVRAAGVGGSLRSIGAGWRGSVSRNVNRSRDFSAPNPSRIPVGIREIGEGAIFFTQELMQELLMKGDRRALLAIMDHKGTRAMDATAYFVGHGFENAKCVRGGIDAWSVEVDNNLPRYELE